MTPIQAFYSMNEASKPAADRVYHNNSACRLGQEIPPNERRSGTDNYRVCQHCADLTSNPKRR